MSSFGILTVSDKCSRGEAQDTSGPGLRSLLESKGEDWQFAISKIVPDDREQIANTIKQWSARTSSDEPHCRLIVITGGTGISPSDVTISTIEPLFTKPLPSLAIAMVVGSLGITPFAALSQVAAGVIGETIVLAVPGSRKGSVENLQQVMSVLKHAVSTAMATNGTRHLHSTSGTPLDNNPSNSAHNSRRIVCGCSRNNEEADGADTTQSGSKAHEHPRSATDLSNRLGSDVSKRARSSPYPMIAVDTALDLVLSRIRSPAPVVLPLNDIRDGHVLAQDVIAMENVPAYPASIMDGYAVISSDGPGTYRVRGSSTTGANTTDITAEAPLKLGEIARITTGAPVPYGADAVVMVEDTLVVERTEDGEESHVKILESGRVSAGQYIRPIGYDTREHTVILRAGTRITAVGGEIGTMATSGNSEFSVYGLPSIAVMSTGDEIVDVLDTTAVVPPGSLRPGTIRDSNRPAIIAALRTLGCNAVDLGIVKDDPDVLTETIERALDTCDGIITTGGVSMGERDWLKPVAEQRLGGEIVFGRVAMKPSKPTTFVAVPRAQGPEKFIFALPGNPASALVAFHMFTAPAIRKIAGYLVGVNENIYSEKMRVLRPSVNAEFVGPNIVLDKGRPEFVRGILRWSGISWKVHATGAQQQSSRMASMQTANSLIALPRGSPDKQTVANGETVTAIIIGSPQF